MGPPRMRLRFRLRYDCARPMVVPPESPARGLPTGARAVGTWRPAGSKSIAQRAIFAAALARGATRLEGLPAGDDVAAALRCARALGASFPGAGKADDPMAAALMARGGGGVIVGRPPGRGAEDPWCPLPVGESGTSARLALAIAALARTPGSGAELEPSGTLGSRSSAPLVEALRGAGIAVQPTRPGDGGLRLSLVAGAPPATLELRDPVSSQEVSALLLALAAATAIGGTGHELLVTGPIPSEAYVPLTEAVLRSFGAHVDRTPLAAGGQGKGRGGTRFLVQGPLVAPDGPFQVEPDASSAGVALGAAAVTGGRVTIDGLGLASAQPDARGIHDGLLALGCDVSGSGERALVASGPPTRGATFDCAACPDAAPVLAAVAARAARDTGGVTTLTGLETLPGKESSRIEVLARGLASAGYEARADAASLRIGPPAGAPRADAVTLDPAGDHRMAFAFALLSLFEPGLLVNTPGCVAKSWPGFWRDLEALLSLPDSDR